MITLAPEQVDLPFAVTVTVTDATIGVSTPQRHVPLITLLKASGFFWSHECRQWQRTINPIFHGTVADRTVNLVHRLLLHHFIVDLPDYMPDSDATAAFIARVQEGDYLPEHTRWVSAPNAPDTVIELRWAATDDLYPIIRRMIPESVSAGRGAIHAQPKYYAVIRDLADRHGFRITSGAERRLADAETQRNAALLVIAPRVRAKPEAPTAPDSAVDDIPAHLRDDDAEESEP